MRLSILSDGYLSDSMNDAGPMHAVIESCADGAVHFAALCRGIAVLVALAVPIGLTLLVRPAPAPRDVTATASAFAAPAPLPHSKSQG